MKQTEIVLVASGKGGVGKSTFIINMASVLADKGNKVCLIDLDLNLGKLDILLGLEKYVEKDMSDILFGNTNALDALIKSNKTDNLYLLPAGRSIEEISINKQQLTSILNQLEEENFDFIFLDCPAGVDVLNPFRTAAKCSERAIIVTTPEKPSLRDADSTISVLENYNFHTENKLHLVINRYSEPKLLASKKHHLNPNEIQTTLAIPLLGIINDNTQYRTSVNLGEAIIYHNNKIYSEFEFIADKILEMSKGNSEKPKGLFKIFSKKA